MFASTPQLQPDHEASWSQLMACAQKQQAGMSAQTCWPHVMRLPPSSQYTPVSCAYPDTDLDTAQALLNRAGILLMDTTNRGRFQQAMHYRLLDMALLQVWCYIPASEPTTDNQQQPAVLDEAASSGEEESARRLAGFVPTLAKLLSHMVKVTNHNVMLALQQQLVEVDQLDKLGEVNAVMSMGLGHQQVWHCSLDTPTADSFCLPHPCSCSQGAVMSTHN